ncbi:MAG: hypothetical protein M1831_004304 [Alyxoria varia]|nr:MAG: hypothetical protein M1831_004304 [Alyxoria varia]
MAGPTSLFALCIATASLVTAVPVMNAPEDPEVGFALPLPDYDAALANKEPIVQRDPKFAPSRGSFGELLVYLNGAFEEPQPNANPGRNPFPGECKVHAHATPDPNGEARVSLCTFDPKADPEYTVLNTDIAQALGKILNTDGVTNEDAYLGGLARIDGPQPMYALIERMDMFPPKNTGMAS